MSMNWIKKYAVQVCHCEASWGMTEHLKVKRRDGKDGISWDTLQQIKNDVLGGDICAVEIYPPENEVVNEVNMKNLVNCDAVVNIHKRNGKKQGPEG